jgi:hypothetical protein
VLLYEGFNGYDHNSIVTCSPPPSFDSAPWVSPNRRPDRQPEDPITQYVLELLDAGPRYADIRPRHLLHTPASATMAACRGAMTPRLLMPRPAPSPSQPDQRRARRDLSLQQLPFSSAWCFERVTDARGRYLHRAQQLLA